MILRRSASSKKTRKINVYTLYSARLSLGTTESSSVPRTACTQRAHGANSNYPLQNVLSHAGQRIVFSNT